MPHIQLALPTQSDLEIRTPKLTWELTFCNNKCRMAFVRLPEGIPIFPFLHQLGSQYPNARSKAAQRNILLILIEHRELVSTSSMNAHTLCDHISVSSSFIENTALFYHDSLQSSFVLNYDSTLCYMLHFIAPRPKPVEILVEVKASPAQMHKFSNRFQKLK